MDVDTFKNALQARLDNRLKLESFESLTAGGSRMRFDMALAINGNVFELPLGSDKEDYTPLLTDDQYFSNVYDSSIDAVFSAAYDKYL